jgi:signal transduction histidine kinase
VTLAENEITLEVKDKGKGMPEMSHPDGKDQAGKVRVGMGISSMRERVSQLGGRLEISSGKKGTTLKAALPLHKTEAATE